MNRYEPIRTDDEPIAINMEDIVRDNPSAIKNQIIMEEPRRAPSSQ